MNDPFNSGFLTRLERLRLRVRRVLPGVARADRRSRRTGSSMEFADYRNYSTGDDLRHVDWSIYGRLDRVMVKLYEEEEDLEAAILIDASRSMRWRQTPTAPARKMDQAMVLAASLSYLTLHGLDRIGLWYFDSALRGGSGVLRGRKSFSDAMRFLGALPEANEGTNMLESLRHFARNRRRRGLAIVMSDCLDPAGFEQALGSLTGRHFALHLVHILDPEEANPPTPGDFVLRDCEGRGEMAVTANPALLKAYQKEERNFRESVKSWCARNNAGYSHVPANAPFEDVLLRLFRKDGLLR